MSHLYRLYLTIFIIFFSITLGYFINKAIKANILSINWEKLDRWRNLAQSLAILVLFPIAAMLSLWGLPKIEADLLFLPFLGLLTYSLGGGFAVIFAYLMGLDNKQTGSLYCCGSFNNIGAIGGVVCLIFLGENSIALVSLFRIFEEIYFFGLSFPIARYYANKSIYKGQASINKNYTKILFLIICALVCGILLNVFNIERPPVFGDIAYVFVLGATVIFLITIGLTLRFSSIIEYIKPSLAICLIKFFLLPLCIIGIALFLNIDAFDNGLALKVVAILSSMPVAMSALAPAALFDLDLNLANSCWIVSTFGLLVILPVLFYLLPEI